MACCFAGRSGRAFKKGIDVTRIKAYGYVAFDGNYFWVPGTDRNEVKMLEYGDRLKIYLNREDSVEYRLPADGIKNQRFSPEGMPPPRYQPRNRKRPTAEEEKRLRAMSPLYTTYLKERGS